MEKPGLAELKKKVKNYIKAVIDVIDNTQVYDVDYLDTHILKTIQQLHIDYPEAAQIKIYDVEYDDVQLNTIINGRVLYEILKKRTNLCTAYFDTLQEKILKTKRCQQYGCDIKAKLLIKDWPEGRVPYVAKLYINSHDYIGIRADLRNPDFTSYVYVLV